MTLSKGTLAYLATPFTKYREGHEAALVAASRIAGKLLKSGLIVYAPITYCGGVARHSYLDMLDLALWLPIEERMCAACDVLIVAHLDGWDESDGIAREVARFVAALKPIYDLDPPSMTMTRRPDAMKTGEVLSFLAHNKRASEQGGAPG